MIDLFDLKKELPQLINLIHLDLCYWEGDDLVLVFSNYKSHKVQITKPDDEAEVIKQVIEWWKENSDRIILRRQFSAALDTFETSGPTRTEFEQLRDAMVGLAEYLIKKGEIHPSELTILEQKKTQIIAIRGDTNDPEEIDIIKQWAEKRIGQEIYLIEEDEMWECWAKGYKENGTHTVGFGPVSILRAFVRTWEKKSTPNFRKLYSENDNI